MLMQSVYIKYIFNEIEISQKLGVIYFLDIAECQMEK